jgi:triosephosphate isomerase
MRTPFIAGNWKMNKVNREAIQLVRELIPLISGLSDVDVGVCPPFTSLADVAATIADSQSSLKLGAQNVYPEPQGAFTGEISPSMLADLGVTHVIVGHSERREIMGEDDEFVAAKLKAALDAGMIPVLCVGETLQEREAGEANSKVENQLQADLASFAGSELPTLLIAYEPIWAIGTGKTATPADAQEMASFIRQRLAVKHGQLSADKTCILYGGSVKASNIEELIKMQDIDGALVGGASLDAKEFSAIALSSSPNL